MIPTQASSYLVQSGDTVAQIAQKNGITTGALSVANPSFPLLPLGILPSQGSILIIPSPLIPPSPALAIFGITLLLFPSKAKTLAATAIALYLYQLYQSYELGGFDQVKEDLYADETQGITQSALSIL